KVKAKIFSRLFYRHWSAFTEFKRSHLFVVGADAVVGALVSNAQALGTSASTIPRDLTPGDHDVPPFHLGGQDMYAISPDGKEVAYTSNIDEVEATSTNNEIFVVPISGGMAKKISTSPGADTTPLYSPDGKYLAWRSQARAGFEADKWRLLVQDRQSGKTRDLTEKFDRSVGSFAVTKAVSDPRDPYTSMEFTAEDHGEAPIFGVVVQENRPPIKIADGHNDDLLLHPDGTLYLTRMSISGPNEIWSFGLKDAGPVQITHMNDALL